MKDPGPRIKGPTTGRMEHVAFTLTEAGLVHIQMELNTDRGLIWAAAETSSEKG